MTPIAGRLNTLLEAEKRRMQSEWFFKWHFINGTPAVEMDDFKGGRIRLGGIKFDGSPRAVYWDSIKFYLRQKISEVFDEVETAIRDYPVESRPGAIEECQALISEFVAGIKKVAIDTDRVLRGDGINFPERDEAQLWLGADAASIESRADGLRAIYCVFV